MVSDENLVAYLQNYWSSLVPRDAVRADGGEFHRISGNSVRVRTRSAFGYIRAFEHLKRLSSFRISDIDCHCGCTVLVNHAIIYAPLALHVLQYRLQPGAYSEHFRHENPREQRATFLRFSPSATPPLHMAITWLTRLVLDSACAAEVWGERC